MIKKQEIIEELKNKIPEIDISALHDYAKFIESKNLDTFDIAYFTDINNRLIFLEERLGTELPVDYKKFISSLDETILDTAEWIYPEEISFAVDFDIVNFIIVEEFPELLSIDDCRYIIPILRDNDSYVLMDLRDNGKGVFVIWSDEEELAFQSKSFTEFKKRVTSFIKKNPESIEFNFFDF